MDCKPAVSFVGDANQGFRRRASWEALDRCVEGELIGIPGVTRVRQRWMRAMDQAAAEMAESADH